MHAKSRNFFCKLKDTSIVEQDANLWKVADKMSALAIHLRQNVEEKRFDIKVQRLVVQEQFGKQAQVLTIQLQSTVHSCLHLIKREQEKLFPSHKPHRVAMISISSAPSQTPVYNDRPRIQTWLVHLWCASLCHSLCLYWLHLHSTHRGWPGWVDLGGWLYINMKLPPRWWDTHLDTGCVKKRTYLSVDNLPMVSGSNVWYVKHLRMLYRKKCRTCRAEHLNILCLICKNLHHS